MIDTVHVDIKQLDNGVHLPLPFYQTPGSAAMDLYAAVHKPVEIYKGTTLLVPTGIAIGLPVGMQAEIRPRSGLALKHGITVGNSPGTIDSDYRGEVKVLLYNFSDHNAVIAPGMRIAQMMITRVPRCIWREVKELEETERAAGGFGSTGGV